MTAPGPMAKTGRQNGAQFCFPRICIGSDASFASAAATRFPRPKGDGRSHDIAPHKALWMAR